VPARPAPCGPRSRRAGRPQRSRRSRRPRRARLAAVHCEHGGSLRPRRAQRARLATAARLTRRAQRGQVTWIATQPKAGQQRAAQTDKAARAAGGDRNFGRTSERFVSERLRGGERWRPGPLVRRLSERRPATAVTAGTLCLSRQEQGSRSLVTAVTAPVTEPPTAFTAQVTHGDGELPAGPVSAAASATGTEAFTILFQGLEVANSTPPPGWRCCLRHASRACRPLKRAWPSDAGEASVGSGYTSKRTWSG
jgi:hypothetical protein